MNSVSAASMSHGPVEAIHDAKYFFDDGDCMFLVEGVLFKLHKLFLSRDPESMFRHMFSLPQPSTAKTMDKDPIQLSDSAEDFRALCWGTYALPPEMRRQDTCDADIPRLLAAARIFHKYNLLTFETWALDVLCHQCESPKLDCLNSCSQDQLERFLALSAFCECAELRCIVEQKWLALLDKGSVGSSHALVAAEKYGTPSFVGQIYYQLNRKIPSLTMSPQLAFSDLNLTAEQLLRLLSGHVSLHHFWERFRQSCPGADPDADGHNHKYTCESHWKTAPFQSASSSDVLAGLNSCQDFLLRGDLCGAEYVDQVILKIAVGLPNYFVG
ncbi:hypothetical protein B0H10DRAFT_139416 [Mycena sp. CBHHK59/15]|nr:hypothetical protein B0H10DRAFT_139416 [Mycena sp. CBHHK59/15]